MALLESWKKWKTTSCEEICVVALVKIEVTLCYNTEKWSMRAYMPSSGMPILHRSTPEKTKYTSLRGSSSSAMKELSTGCSRPIPIRRFAEFLITAVFFPQRSDGSGRSCSKHRKMHDTVLNETTQRNIQILSQALAQMKEFKISNIWALCLIGANKRLTENTLHLGKLNWLFQQPSQLLPDIRYPSNIRSGIFLEVKKFLVTLCSLAYFIYIN